MKDRVAWNKIPDSLLETKTCVRCSVLYKRDTNQGLDAWSRRRFCSKSCKSRGNKVNLGKKHSIETRKKMSNSHGRGSKNRLWKQDRAEILSNKERHWNSEYKEWRRAVFERDSYQCRMGGGECPTYVESHHIFPWREHKELRYEITNGITLCRAHHPRKKSEEKRLARHFTLLVSVSKV